VGGLSRAPVLARPCVRYVAKRSGASRVCHPASKLSGCAEREKRCLLYTEVCRKPSGSLHMHGDNAVKIFISKVILLMGVVAGCSATDATDTVYVRAADGRECVGSPEECVEELGVVAEEPSPLVAETPSSLVDGECVGAPEECVEELGAEAEPSSLVAETQPSIVKVIDAGGDIKVTCCGNTCEGTLEDCLLFCQAMCN
jgi:hypothetical protein